jgi:hypothetical protein
MASHWFELGVVTTVELPLVSDVRFEEAPTILAGAGYRAWKGGDVSGRAIIDDRGLPELIVLNTDRFWLSGKPEHLRKVIEGLQQALREAEWRATNNQVSDSL